MDIKSWSGRILFTLETDQLKVCLQAAVEQKKDLTGAYLRGADLTGAYLTGADGTKRPIRTYQVIGPIGSRGDYLTYFRMEEGGEIIRTGCWTGDLAEFEKRVASVYPKGNEHRTAYDAAIAFLKATTPSPAHPASGGGGA